jgi:hypothetical protein
MQRDCHRVDTFVERFCWILCAIVLLLLVVAGRSSAQPSAGYYEVEFREFEKRWNAVTEAWNDATRDLQQGRYPAAKLRVADRALMRLREHPLWVKYDDKEKK